MFHLHVRYRSRDGGGSCDAARQYIAREGRYRERGDKVRWVRSINMPEWVQGVSAPNYWRSAEGRQSRVNARTAILVEFAVPKLLTREDQDSLVLGFAKRLSELGVEGECHLGLLPITMAFHEGYGRNPHVHLLISPSMNDGVPRCELGWFRRHSAKCPMKGGARRSEYVTKRRWLYRVRELWASMANAALMRRGMGPMLDHRSHLDRGLAALPQIHLGPRVAEMSRLGMPTARGSRSWAIDRANAAALDEEAQLHRRRQALLLAQEEEHSSLQFEREWRARQQAEWIDLLRDHPLTRAPSEMRSYASFIITESDPSNSMRAGQALSSYPDVRVFADILGPAWDAVATAEGFWAVKPGQQTVVFVGRGYVATDGKDEDSLRAVLSAAPMLRMNAPVIAVQRGLIEAARRVLDTSGCRFRLIPIDSKVHRDRGPLNEGRRT